MESEWPLVETVALGAGPFRIVTWQRGRPGRDGPTAVFLHGLSGVAEVWTDTIAALGVDSPRCVALDQRGHGHSPRMPGAYAAADYLGDVMQLIEHLGGPVHLVGHSMGARVAIFAAARRPDLLVSATIVDIGPEAWQRNIDNTARFFGSLPQRFGDRAEALEVGRAAGRGDAWAERFVEWRLRPETDGSYRWLASTEGLIETVRTQRARGYWRDWDRVAVPAIFVRGGATKELRARVADEMARRNPSVRRIDIDGVSHNIPLLAPTRLAAELAGFWSSVEGAAGSS